MYAVLKFLSLISQYSHKLMGTTVCSLLPFSVHAFHYNRYCCGYGTVLVCRNEIHMWPHTIIITIIISYFLSISLFFGFLFRLCLLFLLPSCGVVFFSFRFSTSNSFQRFSCRRHRLRRPKYIVLSHFKSVTFLQSHLILQIVQTQPLTISIAIRVHRSIFHLLSFQIPSFFASTQSFESNRTPCSNNCKFK